MQITQDNAEGHQINAYDATHITIDSSDYQHSLILNKNNIICPWTEKQFTELTEADFTKLIELKPHIVLLGTGRKQHYPSPAILLLFHQHQIGLECMSTAAACRTYNVLAAEGRQVAAGLILDKE